MTPDDMEAVVSEWLDVAQRVEPIPVSTIRGVPICQAEIDAFRALLLDYQERGRALERIANPEYGIGFNRLRGIARATLKGKSHE